MAKEIKQERTIQLKCGELKAGPNLSFLGRNSAVFVKRFNEETKDQKGVEVLYRLILFTDGSYESHNLGTPITVLIKNAANEKREIKKSKLEEIVRQNMQQFRTTEDFSKAYAMIEGTIRNSSYKLIEE